MSKKTKRQLEIENCNLKRCLGELVKAYVMNPTLPKSTFIACITPGYERGNEYWQMWMKALSFTSPRQHKKQVQFTKPKSSVGLLKTCIATIKDTFTTEDVVSMMQKMEGVEFNRGTIVPNLSRLARQGELNVVVKESKTRSQVWVKTSKFNENTGISKKVKP